jgi:hypothetical protein
MGSVAKIRGGHPHSQIPSIPNPLWMSFLQRSRSFWSIAAVRTGETVLFFGAFDTGFSTQGIRELKG